jgi:hypothetical protein
MIFEVTDYMIWNAKKIIDKEFEKRRDEIIEDYLR